MGYALFANRKIMYSNMIFYLQMQLNQLSEEKLNNMMFTSSISDGELLPEEIFEDCGNASMYGEYIVNEDLYVGARMNSENGDIYQLDGTAVDFAEFYWQSTDITEDQRLAANTYQMDQYRKEYAKKICEKFEYEDQRLDQKIAQIETKITALQKNLEKVEEQEGKAIDAATPNYGGVA